jgi:hypothetical protein
MLACAAKFAACGRCLPGPGKYCRPPSAQCIELARVRQRHSNGILLTHRAACVYHQTPAIGLTAPTAPSKPWSLGSVKLFGDDGFNFRDVLDLINPLQHIPVLGNIYRKLTGDVAAPAIRIAGGALFGGPLGAAFAAANVVVKEWMRSDVEPGALVSADKALAARAPQTPGPVGWPLVNSHRFPLPDKHGAVSPRTLHLGDTAQLKQTYGIDAIEAQRRHLFTRFHATA